MSHHPSRALRLACLHGTLLAVVASAGCELDQPGVVDPALIDALDQTFTGSVSSSRSWSAHYVELSGPGTIDAVLDWTTSSANLNLYLADSTGASLARSNGSSRPEHLQQHVGAGTYRLGVSARSGSSAYTLTVRMTLDGGGGPGCAPEFPGDLRCGGLVYGSSIEGGDPTQFEAALGNELGVFRSYMNASTATSKFVSRATNDLANHRIPLISTKLPGSWAAVAAGQHDAWLLERIRGLSAVDGPVWLCLHHEPSNDGIPADWVKMQQHARQLIDANSENIALVGILNGWDFIKNNATPEVWYHAPGTGVHVMGYDSYNPWSPTNGATFKSPEDVLKPGVTIAAWGYPTLVGEYGVRTYSAEPGRSAQWLRDLYALALGRGYVAISYFNSGANSPDGPWTLDGERLAAFKELLGRTTSVHL